MKAVKVAAAVSKVAAAKVAAISKVAAANGRKPIRKLFSEASSIKGSPLVARITMSEPAKHIVSLERRETQGDDLPSMLERLARDVTKLFDQKLALLRIEVREEVNAYVRGAIVILAGVVVAAVGFALANVALAFAVSTLFVNMNVSQSAKYALGFVTTGVAYLVIGTVVIVVTKNYLAKQGILPRRTLNEFQRDKEWIQNDIVD